MDRRTFLQTTGAIGSVALLAGCAGDGGGDDTTTTTTTDAETSTTTTTETTETEQAEPFTIGVLLPFSGTYSWVGANVLPVVEMITEEINNQGGVTGREINIVQGDTEGSPDASITATERLINVEGVQGIIGPTSITMSAVFDQFGENEVPIITPTAGTTSLDDRGGDYVFRTVASDSLGGRAIAKAARETEYNSVQNFSQMALVVGNEEVFQSFKAPIKSSFTEFGGAISTEIDFRTGKASYQSEVQSIMDADPEITALIGPNDDSVKIMESAFQAGYDGEWFATQDQTNEEFLAQSSDKVTDGMFGLQAASYQPAVDAGVMEEFKDRIFEYAGWSELKIFGTNAYDAMNLMGLAMKQAASASDSVTGSTIASNIRTVASPPGETVTDYSGGAPMIEAGDEVDYQGVVGPINFDEDGDIVAPFKILQAEGTSWNDVSRLPPEALE